MTVQELGATTKQKYPEYADIPDVELGNKILAKYPEYQNQITRPETPKDTRGTGEKIISGIASLTGGKKLAETAGTLLAGQDESLGGQNAQIIETLITQAKKFPTGSMRRKELLTQANKIAQQYSSVADEQLASLPTNRQVLGSAAKLAATVGTLGLAPASGATALGRVAQTATKIGGLSAISGGATAVEEGLGNSEAVKGALGSGAVGFILGGVGQSIAELGTFLTSPSITEGIYDRALHIPKRIIEKGKSPSGLLLKEGVSGSKSGILQKAQTISKESEGQITEILSSNTTKIRSQEVIGKIQEELSKKFGNTLSADDIKIVVDKLPLNALRRSRTLPVSKLNALRSELDNEFLGSARWLNDSTAERIVGLKTATNVMRGLVQATDERLPAMFSRWSDAITASRALRSELAKPHIMTNVLEIMGSLLYGGATGGISVEGLKNALVAFGLAKGATSAPVGTGAARLLGKAGRLAPAGRTISAGLRTITPGVSGTIGNQLNR